MKKYSLVLFCAGICIFSCAIAGYFLTRKIVTTPQDIAASQNTTSSFSVPSGWITYSNNAYGFSISHPASLTPETTFSNNYHLSSSWRSGAFEEKTNGRAIIAFPVFRVEQSNTYPRYFDGELRVGASMDQYDIQHCMDNDQGSMDGEIATKNINGIEFTAFPIHDAAMMQSIKGVSYRAIRNGICFAMEALVSQSNYRDDPITSSTLSDETLDSYYKTIEAIAATFRFN